MSVSDDGHDDNAAATTTTPATKRKSSEVIRDQHDGSESREQKRIKTNQDDGSETSGEQEDNNIRTTGRRRSPRRGTVTNWLLFMMPTFDLPSTNPPNSYDQQARYIVRKTLYEADLSLGQARLLLTRTEINPFPLSEFLTDAEDDAVHGGEGLLVRAFDWHGREYGMVFKFLGKTRAYRLIKQWGEFLRVNKSEMSAGNVIETTWYRRAQDGEVCVDLRYVRVEMHKRKAAAAAPVCKKVRKREFEEPMIKHKINRIKIKHEQNHELVVAAVAEQQRIVSAEPEFPTADELLVAEALLLLHARL